MKTSRLGRTGLRVSRIGFGGLFVASSSAQYEEARKAVARGLERRI